MMKITVNTTCFRLACLVLVVVLSSGCLEQGSIFSPTKDGAPIALLEGAVQVRSQAWHKENSIEVQNLKELAAREGWKLLVASGRSIKKLDLSSSSSEIIYSTRNRISYAGIQPGGEIGLIEDGARGNKRKNAIVILKIGKEPITIPLTESTSHGSYLGGNPVLVFDGYSIFQDGLNVVAHSIADGKKLVLLRVREGTYLFSVRENGSRLFLVMVDNQRRSSSAEMVVFTMSSAFRRMETVKHVTNLIMVGENVVLERAGEMVKYCPGTRETIPLGRGTLLTAINHDSFLFTESPWKMSDLSWMVLDISLKEYSFAEGTKREVAGKFSIDECYGVTYPFVCPDAKYVLVADNTESALIDSEYLVYDIASGKKAGAFYEPYMGKCYFSHVLGWTN